MDYAAALATIEAGKLAGVRAVKLAAPTATYFAGHRLGDEERAVLDVSLECAPGKEGRWLFGPPWSGEDWGGARWGVACREQSHEHAGPVVALLVVSAILPNIGFMNGVAPAPRNATRQAILEALESNPSLSADELVLVCDLTRGQIGGAIKRLSRGQFADIKETSYGRLSSGHVGAMYGITDIGRRSLWRLKLVAQRKAELNV